MKELFLLLGFFNLSIQLSSQTLNGKIIDGLGEEGLPNVQIEVPGFTTTFSDQISGSFSLTLPGLRPGARIPLDVSKKGYAVINREAIRPRLPDNPLERVLIYMAPKDKRNELALSFYKIHFERNIQVSFDAAAKRFAEEANYAAIAKLHEDMKSALKMSDSLAARLSRFDPQLASNDLTYAMQLYQEGKVQEALTVLDVEKILHRIEERVELIAKMEIANQQDIESLMKAADMALTEFQFDKALDYYKAAVEADTSHVEHLRVLCEYLKTQNQNKAVIHYAELMQRNAKEEIEIIWALRYKAFALAIQGNQAAIEIGIEALDRMNKLANDKPQSFKSELAITLGKLGNVYANLGYYEEARLKYQESLNHYQKLAKKNPQRFEPEMGKILMNRGIVYRSQGQYLQAQPDYHQSLELWQKLAHDNPQRFEPDLAETFMNLGVIHFDMGQYKQAQSYFLQSLAIQQKLIKENPQRFEPELATTLMNLGAVHGNLGDFQQALSYYEQTLQIDQKLARNNPQRFEPNLAITFMNIGNSHARLGQTEKAISYFQRSVKIQKKLSEDNPERFKPYLAMTLGNLGNVYTLIGQYEQALAHHRQSIDIRQTLAQNNPNKYKPELAKNFMNLGAVHGYLGQYAEALTYFRQSLKIRDNLTKANPQRFEPDLANTFVNLGVVHSQLRQYQQAFAYFHKSLELFRKLSTENPIRFYPLLSNTYVLLASYYRTQLLLRPDTKTYDKGLKTITSLDSSLSRSPNTPYVENLKERVKPIRQFFQTVDLQELELIVPSYALRDSLSKSDLLPVKISLQKQIALIYEEALEKYPTGPSLRDSLTKSLDSLAGWQLQTQKFAEAEASSKKCLSINSKHQFIHRYLAPSLLFQGKFSKAKKLYNKWREQPWPGKEADIFQEVFLADITELEASGITHPDVEKIQKLLRE